MAAWDRVQGRRSIIRDACDLTALCSFGNEQIVATFTLLAKLSGPVGTEDSTKRGRKTAGSAQLRRKKIGRAHV